MGTLVTIDIVNGETGLSEAFEWFRAIEACCTRFEEQSELRRLVSQVGVPVPVSAILFEAIRFAVTLAEQSGGAFDPVVPEDSALQPRASYRDLYLDDGARTITLLRPLSLDLGAVAKGLAVDTAARHLQPSRDFAIDAGGDLYLGGHNAAGLPWTIGIRHPRLDAKLIASVRVTNQAVCTSGDYERGSHIRDPRTGDPAIGVASATVIAPSAMLADAVATAAFVLGPREGIAFMEQLDLGGLIVSTSLERFETRGFCQYAA